MNLLILASVLTASFAANSTDLVVLKNGEQLIGSVTAVTADSMTVSYSHDGTPITATLNREALDPHSWVLFRSERAGDDARARLDLAGFAADHGLFAFAERELDRAGDLDASLASQVDVERKRVRVGAAHSLLALGRAALAKGDLDRAYQLGSTVMTRYRDGVNGDEGLVFVDDVEHARAAAAEQAVAVAKVAADRAVVEARAALVKPAKERIEQARKRNIAGLRQDDLNGALAAFDDAVRLYRSAQQDADAVAEKHGNDASVLALVNEVRREATSGTLSAHVNMGSLYLVRGSYVKALNHANEALAVNQEDAYAQAFRARVEIASAQSSRNRTRAAVK